jgi:hypothetical protein
MTIDDWDDVAMMAAHEQRHVRLRFWRVVRDEQSGLF